MDQYQSMILLEQSVQELHQMFMDLAYLVEAQGDMLNNIQHNVQNAASYIDEGNAALVEAIDYRIGMKKMQFAPGLVVRNDSSVKILVILSQLTPLHWDAINPGEVIRMKCGRVFFTVSADVFDEKKVPSKLAVAGRIATITAATIAGGLLGFGPAGLAVMGTLSGVTSVKSARIDGVYANGKTVVFDGRLNENTQEYELYCTGIHLGTKY